MVTRRSDSEMLAKIEEMIQQEPDPQERSRLLVQHQSLRLVLDTVGAVQALSTRIDGMNTSLTNHQQTFVDHVQEEQKIFQQGKLLWRVIGPILVLSQTVLGYLYVEHVRTIKELQTNATTLTRELEVMKERLKYMTPTIKE